jgi:hypothetical protein
MSAALQLDYLAVVQQWHDGDAELALWGAALKLYFTDARSYQRNGRAKDSGAAWHDLHSDRRQLARLCAPVGLQVQLIGDLMALELATLSNLEVTARSRQGNGKNTVR